MSVALACAGLLSFAILVTSYSTSRRTSTPQGPKPLPFIGNALDFPQKKPWITFASWKEQYGDISYINILGTPMIILNSQKTCTDLLDKRSAKYSSRARSVMMAGTVRNKYFQCGEPYTDCVTRAGFDYSFPIMPYAPRWRVYRRLFHQYFNERVSPEYHPIQRSNVHHFLQNILAMPEGFLDHTRLLFGRTIMDVVYDIKVDDTNNGFIRVAEEAMEIVTQGAIPGQFLVDIFPILKYVPAWFPGAQFKVLAAEYKKMMLELRDAAFRHVKKNMEEGTAGPSVLASMLERCDDELSKERTNLDEEPEDIAKGCAALAYVGGADTTLSTIQTFFMVMANHPEVQQTARIELEALLGPTPDRLPSFEDKPRLPFISAIIKELLRWHNVLPLGLPHLLTEDDDYDGYMNRKGTLAISNIWRILHDPEIYHDPFTFNPNRWLIDTPEGLQLGSDLPEPEAAFGFGRRICPGRHFALHSLFLTISNILTCFDIKPLDAYGKPTGKVQEEFTEGLIVYPVPFNVSLTIRSESLAQLAKDLDV